MTADHVKAGSFTFRVVNMNILQDWVRDGNWTMHGLFNYPRGVVVYGRFDLILLL
jgi:hypothetical protein